MASMILRRLKAPAGIARVLFVAASFQFFSTGRSAGEERPVVDVMLIPAINGFRAEHYWLPAKAYEQYVYGKYFQRKEPRCRFTPVVGVVLAGNGSAMDADIQEFSNWVEWRVRCAGSSGERKTFSYISSLHIPRRILLPQGSKIAFPVGLHNRVKLRDIDNLYVIRSTRENGNRTDSATDRLGARQIMPPDAAMLGLYPLVTSAECPNMPRVVIDLDMDSGVRFDRLGENRMVDARFVLVVSNTAGKPMQFEGFKSKAWKMVLHRPGGASREIDLGLYVQHGVSKYYDKPFDVFPGESFALLLGLEDDIDAAKGARLEVSYSDGRVQASAAMRFPPETTVIEPDLHPGDVSEDTYEIEF